MGRFWSLLFLAVPILGTLSYLAGMFLSSGPLAMWFPENINAMAHEVDQLHDIILAMMGVVFIWTGIAIFWFMWKYNASSNQNPSRFVHGNNKLEFIWTIIPTIIFIALSVYQLRVWADVKINRPMLAGVDGELGTADDQPLPPHFEVVGRQFEWRFRYAGEDGLLDTVDDYIGEVNELHVPVGERMVGALKAADVLHSFFIPALRLKNDIIPGTRQVIWFTAEKVGNYEIVCTELCGWGHYKMKGRFVVESAEEFRAYLDKLKTHQQQRSFYPEEESAQAGLAKSSASQPNEQADAPESVSRVVSVSVGEPGLSGDQP